MILNRISKLNRVNIGLILERSYVFNQDTKKLICEIKEAQVKHFNRNMFADLEI